LPIVAVFQYEIHPMGLLSELAEVKVEDVKIDSEVASGPDPTRPVAADRVGLGAVFCVAVAASLGVWPWLGVSMFADEGATVYSAHLSWSNLWAQSQHVDLVLLPYYVLIHYWQMVSGNIAWVRAVAFGLLRNHCHDWLDWHTHRGEMVRHHRLRSDCHKHASR
jgi:hypothetical protein